MGVLAWIICNLSASPVHISDQFVQDTRILPIHTASFSIFAIVLESVPPSYARYRRLLTSEFLVYNRLPY